MQVNGTRAAFQTHPLRSRQCWIAGWRDALPVVQISTLALYFVNVLSFRVPGPSLRRLPSAMPSLPSLTTAISPHLTHFPPTTCRHQPATAVPLHPHHSQQASSSSSSTTSHNAVYSCTVSLEKSVQICLRCFNFFSSFARPLNLPGN